MITNLHIKNIGIIDDLEINLNKGFNVLTGETGAGKTLIIDSLEIISGGRFSKDMIRKGETNSFVELCLFEPENENSIDGNIIVSREIYANGRNLCKINGRLVTVNELKEFMAQFIEIHGQNDNSTLLDSNSHLKYLDGFVCKEIKVLKEKYREKYLEYINIKRELEHNYGDDKEKQRKLDLLKYQVNEIEEADLKLGEEDELEEKRKSILNSEKIANCLHTADEAIGQNGVDFISEAIRALEKIENIDNKYLNLNSSLKNIYYELQELSRDVSSYREDTYFEEEERVAIEQRLDLIYSLKRKYGNNISEIIEYKNEIQKEINTIENLEDYINGLKDRLKNIIVELKDYGKKLSDIRKRASTELSEKINDVLVDLEMKNAKIKINVEYNENKFFETGQDDVIFMIKTNVGEEEHELTKIASGGEMSRIMLAIKKVLSETDQVPVLVFDEIDTGISGKAAKAVADKLKTISKCHQVLCISHLASIAAMADYNYYISKEVVNQRTNTNIKLLNEEETIKEIARISSGEINEITLQYASELRRKRAS